MVEKVRLGEIVSQPSAEDLRPTEEQREEQRILLRWEKRAGETDWVVGRPYTFGRPYKD